MAKKDLPWDDDPLVMSRTHAPPQKISGTYDLLRLMYTLAENADMSPTQFCREIGLDQGALINSVSRLRTASTATGSELNLVRAAGMLDAAGWELTARRKGTR